MSTRSKNEPERDPYDVLGVSQGASDADIIKAYRKLALRLHPDKQKGLSEAELDKVSREFHDIQQARSFLLDAEHQEDRRKYDAKRASDRARREADAAREKGMSERRKRMREELKRKEEQARALKQKDGVRRKRKNREDDELLEKLRREGREMREAYADRNAADDIRKASNERKHQKASLEDRQVRLKWSRRKMRISPSEHSIATLLSKFGSVERVEMIGSKGNAALVTFADADSCRPCVDAYADSDEMRASFVGKRKEREEEHQHMGGEPVADLRNSRDGEKVDDWTLRRAAERERLLREMEEENESTGNGTKSHDRSPRDDSGIQTKKSVPFPPPFPSAYDDEGLSSLEKLERAEQLILKDILSPESIRRLHVGETSRV